MDCNFCYCAIQCMAVYQHVQIEQSVLTLLPNTCIVSSLYVDFYTFPLHSNEFIELKYSTYYSTPSSLPLFLSLVFFLFLFKFLAHFRRVSLYGLKYTYPSFIFNRNVQQNYWVGVDYTTTATMDEMNCRFTISHSLTWESLILYWLRP